jgi:predicted nucleic acid-binding protein
MARYVIDAATLLHVLDHDVPIDPGHQLVAPNSIRSEALQLLLDDVRHGRRTEEDALGIHERMTELKMRVLGDRVSRRTAWKFARQDERNSIRDAEYLAVARLQADALVTVDQALADRAADVVPVAPLSALA